MSRRALQWRAQATLLSLLWEPLPPPRHRHRHHHRAPAAVHPNGPPPATAGASLLATRDFSGPPRGGCADGSLLSEPLGDWDAYLDAGCSGVAAARATPLAARAGPSAAQAQGAWQVHRRGGLFGWAPAPRRGGTGGPAAAAAGKNTGELLVVQTQVARLSKRKL